MKFVVIGGTGLIGSKVVANLRRAGHDVLAASPDSGVNVITGAGLSDALKGAQVVVDLANSPSFEDQAAMDFFETAGKNLLRAEAAASVGHHVALSVVGTDRLLGSGYFRAKMAQESLIRAAKTPYTIVHSTQFFEFVPSLAQMGTGSDGKTVRFPAANIQPIVSDDIAAAVTDCALAAPLNGTIEVGGPERMRIADLIGRFLRAKGDARKVIEDRNALYSGAYLADDTLVPGPNARLGTKRFDEWLDALVSKSA